MTEMTREERTLWEQLLAQSHDPLDWFVRDDEEEVVSKDEDIFIVPSVILDADRGRPQPPRQTRADRY